MRDTPPGAADGGHPQRLVIVPRLVGGWLVKGAAAGMHPCYCHTIERAQAQARAYLEANGGGEVVVREGARVMQRVVVEPRAS